MLDEIIRVVVAHPEGVILMLAPVIAWLVLSIFTEE